MNVPLRLVVDEAVVRQSYDEVPAGDKPPFETFLAEWVDGIVDELCEQQHFSWRIERQEET